MRDYKLYVKDILAAIDSIETFVQGMNQETFLADDKTASAVVRKFEIIGEATKQIPEEIRQNHPQVPWNEMAGMRNRLSMRILVWITNWFGRASKSGFIE